MLRIGYNYIIDGFAIVAISFFTICLMIDG